MSALPANPLQALGQGTLAVCAATGRLTAFAGRALLACFQPPWYGGQILAQLWRIGYTSLPVVGLTAVFIGAALALNIYTGGARFNAEQFLPNIVVLGITRELGPVLAGLMLAGRVGAGIGAEVGAMRVSDQIDAMSVSSVDPMRYLVAPRVIAAAIALPLLVAVANIIGVMGGFLVATESLAFNPNIYLRNTLNFLEASDVVLGLLKALVFGILIAVCGTYHGFTASGGALGVGRATTSAVVSATVLILAANYLVTAVYVG